MKSRASQPRLIETDSFPFEFLSAVAQRESWRKEVYRPVYHVHKWWAKRLGSVFRGILLGCLLPQLSDLEEAFYERHDFRDISVLDPFMGSGTTVGEAHKLGCVSMGRDINPVACESVRVALGSLNRRELEKAFSHLSSTVGERIRGLYKSEDDSGRECQVLYFFWVKQVPCPQCFMPVDLFSQYVIARNAYPDRKPEVQILCPRCGDIFSALNSQTSASCKKCGFEFNPHRGTASGSKAICSKCSHPFPILGAIRSSKQPPNHRLYGKLLLTPEGKKRYLPATQKDIEQYEQCSVLLKRELDAGNVRLPYTFLTDGYNTRQALNYNYRNWRDFFNDRQLLALGLLQQAISELSDVSARDALLLLFSGVLEFNNLFASYKGEGTGAVRHMFSHHILKPERMPIEANVWGTPKSSGSFSNLFRTRLMRALDYRAEPHEVSIHGHGKVYGCSPPLSGLVQDPWPGTDKFTEHGIYISCESSHDTGLPDSSVDLVVTDPPFFDNVHYSELADFFFAWQILYPHGFFRSGETTRNEREVQDADSGAFSFKLKNVLSECHRILKDCGTLVFTYHHSRAEGWEALIRSIIGASFSVINAHPVKAEMSVAAPKAQAKEPIQLDVILVCIKNMRDQRPTCEPAEAITRARAKTCHKIARIESVGINLSENDRRVILFSQFISEFGCINSVQDAVDLFRLQESELESIAKMLKKVCQPLAIPPRFRRASGSQISLDLD